MLDVEAKIREYLAGVIHMSLATCIKDKPWVCEVHFAFDDKLNLYFRSLSSRRHSKEIAKNPNVAGNIVEPHGLTDKPRAVYFEGKVEQLKNVDENHAAFLALSSRIGLGPEVLEDAKKDGGHKFYKISVENYYLFDSRETSPSQKYKLSWSSMK